MRISIILGLSALTKKTVDKNTMHTNLNTTNQQTPRTDDLYLELLPQDIAALF